MKQTIFDLIIYHYRLSLVELANVTFSNVYVEAQELVDILFQIYSPINEQHS